MGDFFPNLSPMRRQIEAQKSIKKEVTHQLKMCQLIIIMP